MTNHQEAHSQLVARYKDCIASAILLANLELCAKVCAHLEVPHHVDSARVLSEHHGELLHLGLVRLSPGKPRGHLERKVIALVKAARHEH